jgi:PAS domain S-box-containing protein
VSLPNRFFERLAAECPDAVIFADFGGHIRFWNAAATRIFGFEEGEALGRRLDLIIPERLRGRHWEGWNRVIGGAPSRYGAGALLAVPALRKDGGQISIEFTISPLHGEDGTLLGIVAFLRDATARFEEMRALRRELAGLRGASP